MIRKHLILFIIKHLMNGHIVSCNSQISENRKLNINF